MKFQLHRLYSRSSENGAFPRIVGAPGLEVNRLARYWRPLIDLVQTDVAPHRLQLTDPVNNAIASRDANTVLWFSRIGIAGLRHQVLRHAGLDELNATQPSELHPSLRSDQWQFLVDAVEQFNELDGFVRAAIIFQLAQLSFCEFAVRLAASVPDDRTRGSDHMRYQMARAMARLPGQVEKSIQLFESIAATTSDPALISNINFQLVGYLARRVGDVSRATQVVDQMDRRTPKSWDEEFGRAKESRALAVLGSAQRDRGSCARFLDDAREWLSAAQSQALTPMQQYMMDEEWRSLCEEEMRIDAELFPALLESVVHKFGRYVAEDPYCNVSRLAIADAFVQLEDLGTAALHYAAAADLGTGDGATAWYRAGQCFVQLGMPAQAADAMQRCLELDTSAIEPRTYLAQSQIFVSK